MQTASGKIHVERLNLFHRIFDLLYPAIRFVYEVVLSHDWFSEVLPKLWVGGAPTYTRDYEFLLEHGIGAIVEIRAERGDDIAFLQKHDINYLRFRVPDILVPDPETLTEAVEWIDGQIEEGRIVLVHCAKGRGRSVALVAAYLMDRCNMSYEEAAQLLKDKRPLTNLESRHRKALESWISTRDN